MNSIGLSKPDFSAVQADVCVLPKPVEAVQNLFLTRLSTMLRIQAGEGPMAVLMFGYFFLVLAMYMISKAARDAMFIGAFGALKLPYALIAQAVLLTAVVAVYIKFSRRLNHYKLSIFTLLIFAASALALWVTKCQSHSNMVFTFYVWVGIVGAIAPMQVWTMANLIYDARQAKRLFGFISSGGILGSIFGGFVTREFAPLWGTENLLPVIALCLLASAVIVHLLWRRNHERVGQHEVSSQEATTEEAPQNFWQSAALIGRSRYLGLIAGLVAISAMATTVAYVQFSVLARMHLQNTDTLASFFGGLYEGLSWAAFFMQFLFTGRVMNRWGVRGTILVLPLSLLLGSVVALLYPTLWAAVLLRASDQVFRHSIDRSTMEMLYVPIAPEGKIQAKSFIDAVVWRLGDALAAILLMIIAGVIPTLNQTHVTLMNLGMVLPWLVIAYLTGREYVNNLRRSLQHPNALLNHLAAIRSCHPTPNQAYQDKSVHELLAMLESEEMRTEAVRELYGRRSYLRDIAFVEEKIERVLKAEISAYQERAQQERAITAEAQQSLERVFRLLGLLYTPADIYYAYQGITSDTVQAKANALEFLDNVLNPEIKRLLIPVIEVNLT